MPQSEIDAVRALLGGKPRPVGWAERRQRIEEVCSVWPPASDIQFAQADLDGVPAEWSIAPGSDESRVLMFFHGGGYCSGSILSHRRMASEAGRAAGARALAVAYRLAPEHPFPAALDDALTAWRHVRRQAVAAAKIAVGGDSAGAGLSIALLNRLRGLGEAQAACAWLVSPWTDLTMSSPSLVAKDAVDPLIHKGYLEELADAYVPAAIDRKDPRVLPAVCGSERPPAGSDPGRLRRNTARRRRSLRGGGGRGGCRGHARNLAAHDSRLAGLERPSRTRTARARRGWDIHPPRHGRLRRPGRPCGSNAPAPHRR